MKTIYFSTLDFSKNRRLPRVFLLLTLCLFLVIGGRAQYGGVACMGAQVVRLNLTGGTYVAGTGTGTNTIGAQYRYPNANSGNAGATQLIDVLYTITNITIPIINATTSYSFRYDETVATISGAGVTPSGFDANLQPAFLPSNTSSSVQNVGTYVMSATFNLKFFLAGTNTPAFLPIVVQVIDNDGSTLTSGSASLNIGENFAFLTPPSSIVNASPSLETISGNSVKGSYGVNQAGIGTGTNYIAYGYYSKVSTIDLRYSDSIVIAGANITTSFSSRFHSFIIGCDFAGNVNFPIVNLSGTVFNDINGLTDNTVNGTGTGLPSGVQLYANLLNSAGIVVDTIKVNSNGTYTFPSIGQNANYTVQISTNAGTLGSAAPVTALPAGWVNTGEDCCDGIGSDGTPNGLSPTIVVGTASISNAIFGIEQRPTATTNTASGVVNPGGTTSTTVPAATFSATDPAGGTIASIRLTTFPSNATSITVNGVTYLSTNPIWPANGGAGITIPTNATGNPTQVVSVDPVDGAVTVGIPYVAIDNAGVESLVSGTANMPFTTVTISGTVFNDLNGVRNGLLDGSGTNAGGLFANLLSGGAVVASVAVNPDGTYTFPSVNGGAYTVNLTTTVQALNATPAASLPSGWVSTAESNPQNVDATVNTTSGTITVTNANITLVNFGIDQIPLATSSTLPALSNPGGTNTLTVSPTGFVTADLAGGTVDSIRITSFPANVLTITLNGTTYTSGTFPAGGVNILANASGQPSTPILFDPVDIVASVIFNYVAVDNAGKISNPATVTIPIGYSISGKLWDNGNANALQDGTEANLTSNGTPTGGAISTGGLPLYAVLTDASGNVIQSPTGNPIYAAIGSDGTYNIAGVPNGSYFVRITSNNPTTTTPVNASTGSSLWVFNELQCGTIASVSCTTNDTGIVPVTMANANVSGVNVGLDKLPESDNVTALEQVNQGGTNKAPVPALTGSDLEATGGLLGTGSTIVIDSLPANGILYYNNVAVVAGTPIPNYIPALLTVDPSFTGAGTVGFKYHFVDAAGFADPSPATVTMPFTGNQLIVNVFNDVNGNSDATINGAAIRLADAVQLYVAFTTGGVTTVYPVNANGQVILGITGQPLSNAASYTIRVTSDPTGAATILPTGWAGTGESSSLLLQTNTTQGDQTIVVTTLAGNDPSQQVVNFGIDKRPTATSQTLASGTNPGGTTNISIPATAFVTTDQDGGTSFGVTQLRITAIPTNATTLTVNGITYGPGFTAFPVGGLIIAADPTTGRPVAPIAFDPMDNVPSVILTYFPIDAAGKEALTSASITAPLSNLYKLNGTVFNDGNANTDGIVNGTGDGTLGAGATQMYVSLVSTGGSPVVLQSIPVNADGTYQFNNIAPNSNYTIVLSTAAGTVGQAAPAPSLPAGFVNTGEDCCDNAGTDGTANGILPVSIVTSDLVQANFGAQQPPLANTTTATGIVNPGGNTYATVPPATFGGTDADGTINNIRLTAFPSNANSIRINGVVYLSTDPIWPANGGTGITLAAPGGVPTQTIEVDPINGAVTVSIPYKTIDNAGAESAVAGSANMPFTTTAVVGTVFNDVNGANVGGINDGNGTNAGGLFATLLDNLGNVVTSVAVNSNGTYTITGVNGGTYSVIISSVSGSGIPTLPAGWVSTGENIGIGTGNDGNANGSTVSFVVSTTFVTNVNFGIEQAPIAGTLTAASQLNPGANNSATVPSSAFSGTDFAGGTVDSIRITAFPSNATSITIGATTYTSANFPAGGVTVVAPGGVPTPVIKVNPIDGAVTVGIPYVAKDNAGKESIIEGLASQPFSATSLISGILFNDPGGDAIMNGTDAPTNGGGTYANLVSSGGIVIASVLVDPVTGIYELLGLPSTNYSIILSSTMQTAGNALTTSSLPTSATGNWSSTGVSINGISNNTNRTGIIAVTTPATGDVTNQDFAIEQAPVVTNSSMQPQANNGYSVPVPANQFTASDNGGTVSNIIITGFPANAQSITINGTKYSSAAEFNLAFPQGAAIPVDGAGHPTQPIMIQPFPGNNTSLQIPYISIDNAGVASPVANVTVPFSVILPLTGLELFATNNDCGINVNWQTLTEVNTKNFIIEYATNGINWQSIGTVIANGNSNSLKRYSILHNTPVKGSNYYRIKAVDKDGNLTYSNIVQLTSSCNGKVIITAYPNPVEKYVTVTGVQAGSQLSIMDANGRILFKQTAGGSGTDKLNIGNMASGLYLLNIVNATGDNTTIKLIKR